MKVLVTGASGYLGQHLLGTLLEDASLSVYAAYGSLETFPADFAKATCMSVDLQAADKVKEMMATVQPDCVVHLAAVSSPAVCEKQPESSMAINKPTCLIEALPPTATFIFLSTDQVYDGLEAPYTESSPPAKPVNMYGQSKLDFEAALAAALPSRSVSLRSSLILGPPTPGRCRKQSFLQFCDERMAKGEATDFFGDETRSVLYVGDIVKIITWLLKEGIAGGCVGVCNMGGPERLTRVDVANAVAAHRGYDAATLVKSVNRKDVVPAGAVASPPDISMDSGKLLAAAGYPKTTLKEMLPLSLA